MSQRPPLLLNVDDNVVGRYGKTRILQEAGFEVIEAGTGTQALELVRSRRPQLVLLDIALPDIDGLEVCRRIRSDPGSQHIPVLHISATYDEAGGESISLQSGGDIFLAEPVEPVELITVVRTLLRLRSTEIGLSESEGRLRLATEGAGLGTWDIDLATGAAHWNSQFYVMLGYPPGGPATWDLWRSRVHADDVRGLLAALEEARGGGFFTHEHRILCCDTGEERWLSPYGRILYEHGGSARLVGVAVDITERKQEEGRRERVLALEHKARAEAERAAKLKDEFLATLSHELRSPMSAILGWLHLLRSGRLEQAEQARALDTIERNARLQNQLINDLLDVSRIVTGKLQLNARPVAVDDIVLQTVEAVKPAAEAKGLVLEQQVDALGVVQGDADRLQQVFVNLLNNAIKFTPAGGRVTLRARRSGDWHRIVVSDTGEGIDPDLLPYLFERFMQADGSTTRRHGGLGLGLAIVRHLVELHDGRVMAESHGAGCGATFTVLLPAGPAAVLSPESTAREPGSSGANRPLRLDGVRVLVVDDEPGAAQLMAQVLRMDGAQVRTASRAADAVALAATWMPEALVLDIGMPDIDGYDLIGELRATLAREGRKAPAVAVTGYASEHDRRRALAAGFDAHLTKPFDVERLLEVLVALVESYGESP